MPDSSPSPAAPASYGSRDAVPAHATAGVNRPQKRQVRLPHAEADLNFAAPLQHQTRQRSRKIQEIPANADVAQLVEHFTRNEGVPGSSPGVGLGRGRSTGHRPRDMPSADHAATDRLALTEGQAASRDRLTRTAAARRVSVLMAVLRGWRSQGR